MKNFHKHKERLGNPLGPSKGICNETCQLKLQPSREVITRSKMCPLTVAELNSKVEAEKKDNVF